MSYYSDFLGLIDELYALEHGINPSQSLSELSELCERMHKIDPDELLVKEIREILATIPRNPNREDLILKICNTFRVVMNSL